MVLDPRILRGVSLLLLRDAGRKSLRVLDPRILRDGNLPNRPGVGRWNLEDEESLHLVGGMLH